LWGRCGIYLSLVDQIIIKLIPAEFLIFIHYLPTFPYNTQILQFYGSNTR